MSRRQSADTLVALGSLVANGGVGALAAAGLVARAKSAAQNLLTRVRQGACTDLVATELTVVPVLPDQDRRTALRRARRQVEDAVRERLLTVPTPTSDIG